jgi:hypothetical protein
MSLHISMADHRLCNDCGLYYARTGRYPKGKVKKSRHNDAIKGQAAGPER